MAKSIVAGFAMGASALLSSGFPVDNVEFVTSSHELYPGHEVYEQDDCAGVFLDEGGVVRLVFFGLKEYIDDPEVYNGMGMYNGQIAHGGTDGYQDNAPNSVESDTTHRTWFAGQKMDHVCRRIVRANR